MLVAKRNLEVHCASDDSSRLNLGGVLFTKEGTVSTDGHLMIKVPYPDCNVEDAPKIEGVDPVDKEHKDLLIDRVGLSKVLKNLSKNRSLPILELAQLDVDASFEDPKRKAIFGVTDLETSQIIRVSQLEGTYPDVNSVVPNPKDYQYTISFALPLLKQLILLLEKGTKDSGCNCPSVTLNFTTPLEATVFKCEDITGLIMPYRGSN
jgi:DNA polymerase III sliding clamp (beta) subunit (PCNA family)